VKDQTVSLQWARAFYEQAKSVSAAGIAQRDLAQALQSQRRGDRFWQFLEHPLLPGAKAGEVLRGAFGREFHEVTVRFLELLVRRRRVHLLGPIAAYFERLADADSGLVRATVKSALPLEEVQRRALENALSIFWSRNKKTPGPKVLLDVREDPDLLGGLAIRMEDWSLENSLRGQLRDLETALCA
jgi:F-type H+-transporting ATPase subunit delta